MSDQNDKVTPTPKKNFYLAFDSCVGSCRGECGCGREFFNDDGTWDFADGELEKLRADKTATELPHAVPFVQFEGVTYVYDCTCWHERANKIQNFIDSHFHQISTYINAEIKDVTQQAKYMQSLIIKG